MSELIYLRDLVVILGFGVIIVMLFHRFKLPSIAGFILAGLLVGPEGFGFINDVHQVEALAEFGVALLLFGIGLELSLGKLRPLWKLITAGAVLQVGLTILAAYFLARAFGIPDTTAIFVGCLLAMSSTAVIMRSLQELGSIDAPHGRLIVGISALQDLSVVPIMMALPILVGTDVTAEVYLLAMARSVGIIVAILLAALLVVPRILNLVARTRQRQLFILSVFLICIGTAWLITLSGASLAIGAFLAGLVVAGSDFRQQALTDLISFKEVFASVFFVSVGMLLAPTIIAENLILVLAVLAAVIVGKAVIVLAITRALRVPLRVCMMTAVALAQVSEFAFVLLFSVQESGLVDRKLESILIAVVILSMFIIPFVLSLTPQMFAALSRLPRLKRLLEVEMPESTSDAVGTMRDHVIVGGYGFAGRELAGALTNHNIPYVVVDISVENVRRAVSDGASAIFGDITSPVVLGKVGAEVASELVLLVNDPGAAQHAVRVARRLAPDLHIVVRTHYLLDIEPILAAGANDVVPAEREAAVEIASVVLRRHKIESEQIVDHCSRIRHQIEEHS